MRSFAVGGKKRISLGSSELNQPKDEAIIQAQVTCKQMSWGEEDIQSAGDTIDAKLRDLLPGSDSPGGGQRLTLDGLPLREDSTREAAGQDLSPCPEKETEAGTKQPLWSMHLLLL